MTQPNRRSFSKTLAGGACLALSASRILGANDRIGVGIIGCGGQGSGNWRNFLAQSDVNPVAVCDVFQPNRERAAAAATKDKVVQYKDFRQLLDNKDVDAVIVATPDHWHSLLTIMACKAGQGCIRREGTLIDDTRGESRGRYGAQIQTHRTGGRAGALGRALREGSEADSGWGTGSGSPGQRKLDQKHDAGIQVQTIEVRPDRGFGLGYVAGAGAARALRSAPLLL